MTYHPENIAPDGRRLHSKSELIIYICLTQVEGVMWDINAWYERRYHGTPISGKWSQWPDFTFADKSGRLLLWEHLGMKGDEQYDADQEKKLKWYNANGYDVNTNLLITYDNVSLHRNNSTFIDAQSIMRTEIPFVKDWVSR